MFSRVGRPLGRLVVEGDIEAHRHVSSDGSIRAHLHLLPRSTQVNPRFEEAVGDSPRFPRRPQDCVGRREVTVVISVDRIGQPTVVTAFGFQLLSRGQLVEVACRLRSRIERREAKQLVLPIERQAEALRRRELWLIISPSGSTESCERTIHRCHMVNGCGGESLLASRKVEAIVDIRFDVRGRRRDGDVGPEAILRAVTNGQADVQVLGGLRRTTRVGDH